MLPLSYSMPPIANSGKRPLFNDNQPTKVTTHEGLMRV